MHPRTALTLTMLLGGAMLLQACATVPAAPPTPPTMAYFVVPCGTPGAIEAAAAVSATQPVTVAGGSTALAGAAPVCVVAAVVPPRYAVSRYYPGRRSAWDYPGGYLGRPYFGSAFLSYGAGHRSGHGGGGHHGGGHGGGHHGGGRH